MMVEFALHIRPRFSPALGRALDRLAPVADGALARRGLTGASAPMPLPGLPHGELSAQGSAPASPHDHAAAGATEYLPTQRRSSHGEPLDTSSAKGGLPGEFEILTGKAYDARPWAIRRLAPQGDAAGEARGTTIPAAVPTAPRTSPTTATDNVHWLTPDAATPPAPGTPASRRGTGRDVLTQLRAWAEDRREIPELSPAMAAMRASTHPTQGLSAGALGVVPGRSGLAGSAMWSGPRAGSGGGACEHAPYGQVPGDAEGLLPRPQGRDIGGTDDGVRQRTRLSGEDRDAPASGSLSDFEFEERLQQALARMLSADLLRHGLSRPGDV